MDSPQQRPVTDEEARRMAKALVTLFRSPLKIFGIHGFDKPVSIADAIYAGGIFLGGFNMATGDPQLKEKTKVFTTQISELIYLPDEMEEFLFNRIKERAETAEGITEAITQVEGLMSGPGAARRFIKKAFAEVLPKARQGRPTEFNPEADRGPFLALSEKLQSVCSSFLNLREQFPRKSIKELLDFLRQEHPQETDLMRKYEAHITKSMNEFEFRILKTMGAKVRRLADAVAGKKLFGWSFVYSFQRGAESRRLKGIDPEE